MVQLVLMLALAMTISCSNKQKHNEISSHASKPAHSSHHSREVLPDKSFGWLVNGNIRYRSNALRTDGATVNDRNRLSQGQKPHAIVLSCSDSRVPPEIIFDQKLGEIFVVRTAGESLDKSAIASIEYAVSHLGPSLIVVMGHESCGAVKAALTTPEGTSAGSASLDSLVNDLRPHMSSYLRKPSSENFVDESWANVHGVVRDLLQRSQIVKDAVLSGEVKVKGALYYLKSGDVKWSDEEYK